MNSQIQISDLENIISEKIFIKIEKWNLYLGDAGLARNLAIEDVLWEEILVSIRDVDARTELLRQRNQIVRDIHTEFRALNIEIPTIVEQKTENFMNFLGELKDDETLEDAINFAGGFTENANENNITILRNTPKGKQVKGFSWNEAKNVPLKKISQSLLKSREKCRKV